jgi:hypothetical protein
MDVIIKRGFKSLWHTFEALVAKMCIVGECHVIYLETFCQIIKKKRKKSHGPNYLPTRVLFYFYYFLFQFCEVGGSVATVHKKRSAQNLAKVQRQFG